MRRRRVTGQVTAEQQVAVELTALALPQVAPDEIAVFDDSVAEYLADPEGTLNADRDTPLGSGIDVAMLTPYVLAVSTAVMPVLSAIAEELVKDVAKDLVKEPLVATIRRLFRRHPAEPPGPVALSAEQAARVHREVLAQGHVVGLSPEQAALVADATVGALYVRP
jgi:hypothetical protein